MLAEAIAKSANLFNQGGRLVWLHEGELRPVRGNVLGDLIRMHVVTKHPVHRGAEGWGVEYLPLDVEISANIPFGSAKLPTGLDCGELF